MLTGGKPFLGVPHAYFTTDPDDTKPPTNLTLSLTKPSDGTWGMEKISATAIDGVAVARIEFMLDAASLGADATAPYEVAWNTRSASDGTHTLRVVATDASGNAASLVRSVTVHNAPTVLLSGPSGTVYGSQTISASAAAVPDAAITSVEFQVDGATLAIDYQAPYTATWSTLSWADGDHVVTVLASDTAGYRVSQSNRVAVQNHIAAGTLTIQLRAYLGLYDKNVAPYSCTATTITYSVAPSALDPRSSSGTHSALTREFHYGPSIILSEYAHTDNYPPYTTWWWWYCSYNATLIDTFQPGQWALTSTAFPNTISIKIDPGQNMVNVQTGR
jgi:hypothetical protein